EALIQSQGFVVASDRLWQMDLMRRSASGHLAEWFGGNPAVVQWDEKRRLEDWEGVAREAARALPADERRFCELYARGVNRFIKQSARRWSAEYMLLGERPREWLCEDSLLILLSMVEDL